MPSAAVGDLDAWIAEQRAKGLTVTETGVRGPAAPASTPPPKAAPRRPEPAVETAAATRVTLEVVVPVRLASEANFKGTFRGGLTRKAEVKRLTRAALPELARPLGLPAVVTMTRCGAKRLDDDNLARALKAVRDVVAGWLGVDDADPRVRFRCRQRAGWEPCCVVRIEVTPGGRA